jgi:hypothetical protein
MRPKVDRSAGSLLERDLLGTDSGTKVDHKSKLQSLLELERKQNWDSWDGTLSRDREPKVVPVLQHGVQSGPAGTACPGGTGLNWDGKTRRDSTGRLRCRFGVGASGRVSQAHDRPRARHTANVQNDFLGRLGVLQAVPDGRRPSAEIAESQVPSKVVTVVSRPPETKKPLIGIRSCGLDQKI